MSTDLKIQLATARGAVEMLPPSAPSSMKHAYINNFENAVVKSSTDPLLRYVKRRLAEIENDSRFKQPPALVQVNAPLALIQVAMKTEHDTLTKVLSYLYRMIGDTNG